MTDPLEAELDRLFRLPPAQLVEARNALADQLRRAGDKAAAARIKAIKRPVPVAWALNQVQLDQPALLEHARRVTDELRELHGRGGVDAKGLAAAVERQRVAMQAVVEAALGAGRRAGMSDNALPPRRVFTTVQAWLAGRGEEPPGRMTQELEASGFEAFAGMTLPASPPPLAPVESAPNASDETERAVAEAEQLAAAALAQAGERQAERAAAERAYEQAQVSVREAERQLAELRAMLEQRTRELERRTALLDDARARHARAEAALAGARAARSQG